MKNVPGNIIDRNKNVIMNDHVQFVLQLTLHNMPDYRNYFLINVSYSRHKNAEFSSLENASVEFLMMTFFGITCKWNVKSKLTFQTFIIKQKKNLEKHFFYKRIAVRTLNLTNANLGQSKEEASFDPKSK